LLQRINILAYVRKYHWLVAVVILLVAMFMLSKPPIPADLNYRYQLDLRLKSYPFVPPTAGLVEWSTERVREVYRWNLTAETVGHAAPPDKAGTEDAILPATILIFLGVFASFMVWFVPAKRAVGIGLIIFVLSAAHLGAHPEAYTKFMAAPSILVPNAAVALVTRADPGRTLGVEPRAQNRLKDMADRYFEHYVTFTEHRMGSAGKVLAGPKRIWFGITGLAYVMPFALFLSVLSALTTLVQTLCWILFMISPFAVALAVGDGRAGLRVWQHVVVPLLATLAILAVLGLALPLVLYLATLVHATENEIGLLAVGSLFPVSVVVAIALLIRRRKEGFNRADHSFGATVPYRDLDRTELLGSPSRDVRSHRAHARRTRQRHLRDLRRRH
jgi:hypothetical protein